MTKDNDKITFNEMEENEMSMSLGEKPTGSDEKEEEVLVRDFDLEMLIVDGKDAVLEREIDFFNLETKQQEKMSVKLKPIPHKEWIKAEAILQNKRNKKEVKDFKGFLIAQSWVDNQEKEIPISTIRKLGDGTINSLYEEIKIISSHFQDRTEDKLLDKIVGF